MVQCVEILQFVPLLQCVSHLRPLDDVDNYSCASHLSDTAVDEQFRSGDVAAVAVPTGDKRNLSIELTELFLVSCHFPVWVGFD